MTPYTTVSDHHMAGGDLSDHRLTDEQLGVLRAAPVNARVPNRVQIAIVLAGVRNQDVVRATGITGGTLSAMLHQATQKKPRRWKLDTVQRLATYFGCRVDDLFPRLIVFVTAISLLG